jgi:hypothetical protein
MKCIKIITSVYGHRPKGSKYIQPKRAGDPPFLVEDEKAERLVAKGVAVYVDAEPVATASGEGEDPETGEYIPDGEAGADGEENAGSNGADDSEEDSDSDPDDSREDSEDDDGSDDEEADSEEKPEYSINMKFDDLRELLKECELPYKVGMTKADIVAALDEFYGENPPELDAEDPIL